MKNDYEEIGVGEESELVSVSAFGVLGGSVPAFAASCAESDPGEALSVWSGGSKVCRNIDCSRVSVLSKSTSVWLWFPPDNGNSGCEVRNGDAFGDSEVSMWADEAEDRGTRGGMGRALGGETLLMEDVLEASPGWGRGLRWLRDVARKGRWNDKEFVVAIAAGCFG